MKPPARTSFREAIAHPDSGVVYHRNPTVFFINLQGHTLDDYIVCASLEEARAYAQQNIQHNGGTHYAAVSIKCFVLTPLHKESYTQDCWPLEVYSASGSVLRCSSLRHYLDCYPENDVVIAEVQL